MTRHSWIVDSSSGYLSPSTWIPSSITVGHDSSTWTNFAFSCVRAHSQPCVPLNDLPTPYYGIAPSDPFSMLHQPSATVLSLTTTSPRWRITTHRNLSQSSLDRWHSQSTWHSSYSLHYMSSTFLQATQPPASPFSIDIFALQSGGFRATTQGGDELWVWSGEWSDYTGEEGGMWRLHRLRRLPYLDIYLNHSLSNEIDAGEIRWARTKTESSISSLFRPVCCIQAPLTVHR